MDNLIEKLTVRMLSWCDAEGCDCQFYNIDGIGVKVYLDKKLRDHCYKWQKYASRFGLGPECHTRFECNGKYCFITEIVDIVRDGKFFEKFETGKEYIEWTTSKRKFLMDCLFAIGIELSDFHNGNWGFRGNDVVMIDFGSPIDVDGAGCLMFMGKEM